MFTLGKTLFNRGNSLGCLLSFLLELRLGSSNESGHFGLGLVCHVLNFPKKIKKESLAVNCHLAASFRLHDAKFWIAYIFLEFSCRVLNSLGFGEYFGRLSEVCFIMWVKHLYDIRWECTPRLLFLLRRYASSKLLFQCIGNGLLKSSIYFAFYGRLLFLLGRYASSNLLFQCIGNRLLKSSIYFAFYGIACRLLWHLIEH